MTESNFPRELDLPQIDTHSLGLMEGNQQPVLVVGMHNSGTSLLTEILHKNGIFFGANMKHYESYFFSNFINDRVILGGGGNWAKLPLIDEEEVLSYAKMIGGFIKKHWLGDYLQWGYDGVSPWGIKDPRLCILLPLYLKIFPQAKVIHIRRTPEDVAASLIGKYKAGVGVLNDFDHWKALTEAYTQRVLDHSGNCEAYIELTYENFCTKPKEQTQQLFSFLSLEFTPKTEMLLTKVNPSRIGSYQRWQESQKHPWRSRLKSMLGR